MAYTTKAAEYLHGGGAANEEVDDFFYSPFISYTDFIRYC